MSTTDKRKQSLYFPEEMLEEIQREASRQIVSLVGGPEPAWKLARPKIASFPSLNDVANGGAPALPDPREETNQ